MLERSGKVFSCFLDVRKVFDTVRIEGILYKLFSQLGVGDRMWKVMKDIYTNVKAQVLYAGSLSRKIDASQGTGQDRIIAPFRVMAIKKPTLGAQFFQRPLNCRVVCGTPFLKNIWVPIFSKHLPGTGIMYYAFSPFRSPTFCHIFRVPGGVRHPSFVVIRQRVRAPGRSPCIVIRQKVREPGRSCMDHLTFTSGHRLVPHLQI